MVTKELREQVLSLPPQERYQLSLELWDSIAGVPEAWPPTPPEVIAELERRAAEADRDPSTLLTWDEVKARVQQKSKKE